ncbi:MAG: DUF5318 family protein [Candidatus Nanopelagicales bacterium]
MAVPRRSGVRGAIVRGTSGNGAAPGSRSGTSIPEPISDPAAPRSVVNFGLQRRAALHRLFNGGALSSDLCDADTYLLRAAKHHGESADGPCPACRAAGFVTVTYVYGDQLGPYSGRIRQTDELPLMATQFGEFKVYVVEVCQRCSWNFLATTYVLGDGVPRRALPKSRDLLD